MGSILITVFTVAFMFFSAVHYILRVGGIGDCTWYGSAKTWIDLNGDGLFNSGEPPLDGVEIHVDDRDAGLVDISWPVITNTSGDAQLSLSLPGCTSTVFELSVDIPEGYRITTRPRIQVQPDVWESLSAQPVYYFGFVTDR
ncbi:MAG TPA: hypothetical protein VGK56_09245 [Anaerolineales bacterium]